MPITNVLINFENILVSCQTLNSGAYLLVTHNGDISDHVLEYYGNIIAIALCQNEHFAFGNITYENMGVSFNMLKQLHLRKNLTGDHANNSVC